MSMHDGHRERMKQRFLEEGLDHFSEVQVLELLLFYAVPLKDTNPIAHGLLDRFGSVSQVLEAPYEELKKVAGIGDHAATLIRLMTALSRFYQVDKASRVDILTTTDECARYMLPHFHGRTVETVFLLGLDAKCKVLGCKEVGEGGINSANVSIRRIVETAIAMGASTAVLAHNHPSGIAVPSREDILTTRRVNAALSLVDVVLLDSLVIAEDDYVSMAASRIDFAGTVTV